ncbi:peptidoglycan-binding protein LysM [Iodidimonas nitroreducens]|uniref:Peptidoglycan-binding protein LysM n=1 Tax=Iodidimonas nitroreducens TaxID=1236968 RepID=A0A5A7NAM6_9PROT|nr:LysM peptidoglycan-binding domain-containing protein [Iodidimonas nitroreducens]GAK32572.1 putative protein [alpha proteobacterium Q-1]GER04530.1 peptidoglycan-binding protein LysM [Iodidimonas nitroreducens]
MSKSPKSDDWSEDNPRLSRPWLSAGLMVLAFAAIIGLAYFNFSGSDQTETSAVGSDISAQSNADVLADAPINPSFDVVRISRGGTGVLAGRAAPESRVELRLDDQVIAEVRADRNGEWVLILEEPLAAGTVELSLRAIDETGEVRTSDDVVVVSIPEPIQPERFVDREGEGVVAVLTPKTGDGPSRVMQKPGLAAPGEVGDSLAVDTVDFGAEGQTILSGRALPRSTVRVYIDNELIEEVRAGDEGRWMASQTQPIADGDHVIRVDQVLTEGEVQLRVEQPFKAGMALDPSQAQSRVVVQPGNTLWTIARKLYGRGTRFTMIFQENSEQIIDPDLIYPGQLFRLPGADESQNGEPAPSPAQEGQDGEGQP